MDNLLGPNPCRGCEFEGDCYPQRNNGKTSGDEHIYACGPYAAYAAKLELLGTLKAGGVYWKHPDEPDGPTLPSFEDLGNFLRQVKVGWLVFIPEAQA